MQCEKKWITVKSTRIWKGDSNLMSCCQVSNSISFSPWRIKKSVEAHWGSTRCRNSIQNKRIGEGFQLITNMTIETLFSIRTLLQVFYNISVNCSFKLDGKAKGKDCFFFFSFLSQFLNHWLIWGVRHLEWLRNVTTHGYIFELPLHCFKYTPASCSLQKHQLLFVMDVSCTFGHPIYLKPLYLMLSLGHCVWPDACPLILVNCPPGPFSDFHTLPDSDTNSVKITHIKITWHFWKSAVKTCKGQRSACTRLASQITYSK